MLPKTYDPSSVETNLYKKWEAAGCFAANPHSGKEPYTIMIPPPNVTGALHCGHALTMTVQDVLCRHQRMRGKDVLWQPGTDHAGIATQRIVNKQMEEQGSSRVALGREKFLEKVWEWKAHSGGTIISQLKRLGASCDWQRERFTMDEGCSHAVRKVFVDLYHKGLIYRGERLVNWDPNYQTAVSDIEVAYKEAQGHIWHLKYPLADGSGFVTVATTRPETMLGDTAVAVNPNDPDKKHLIGKKVLLPLVGREIPVIGDVYVDMSFGSGFVKITPAHDFNDYDIGKRHNLPFINILTTDGRLNTAVPEAYRGLDRFVARAKVVDDMAAAGLLVKVEPHINQVPHAERDDTVLEPFLTTQWYVNTKPLAERALQAVRSGKTEFIPKNWEKTYFNWLENIQDWCISRQLWWGHQIPAWYRGEEVYVGMEAPEGDGWVRDDDVLDTWFSSALWPFSTLGWPQSTDELKKYYPTSVLVTGFDIIFFWVARMMMMGLEFMDDVPFEKVFIHALVRDEHGKKMSKSFGNVLDPLVLIDQYGADALRFAIISLTAPGADIRLGEKKVEEGRNFCTKLWNASRYALMNDVRYVPNFTPETVQHPLNRWILGELAAVVEKVDKAYDDFRFNDNAGALYHFTWGVYCDWYLELTKPILYGDNAADIAETKATMAWVLEHVLRLLSPIMPFITQEIWQSLTGNENTFLMQQPWPSVGNWGQHTQAVDDIRWLVNIVTALRNTRAESKVPPKADITACTRGASAEDVRRFAAYAPFISALTKTHGFAAGGGILAKTDVVAVAEGIEMVLPLAGVVDFGAEQERIAKEIAKLEAELQKINGMLGNPSFIDRAPPQVVHEQQQRQQAILQDLGKLQHVQETRNAS